MAHIKTYARLKPSKKAYPGYEVDGSILKIHIVDNKEFTVIDGQQVNRAHLTYKVSFTEIFSPASTQEDVFNVAAKDIIQNFLNGYNGTIFAYGQTGTGKTYTVEGNSHLVNSGGLSTRALSMIYQHLAQQLDDHISVYLSFLEIYQEVAYDLLNQTCRHPVPILPFAKHVNVCEGPQDSTLLRGLTLHLAANEEVAQMLLLQGQANRRIAETPTNQRSSRSHAVFTVYLQARKHDSKVTLKSKLHLVDLAGSERVSKTGADGQQLTEAKSINLSLHHLETVIVALQSDRVLIPSSIAGDDRTMDDNLLTQSHSSLSVTSLPSSDGGRPCRFVPYRNSLLTMLLKDSLGGNCLTAMIATISMEAENVCESVSTCRFAQRVARVSNNARRNEEIDDKALISRLRQKISSMKQQLVSSKSQGEWRSLYSNDDISVALSLEDRVQCARIMDGFLQGDITDPVAAGACDHYRLLECLHLLKDRCRSAQAALTQLLTAQRQMTNSPGLFFEQFTECLGDFNGDERSAEILSSQPDSVVYENPADVTHSEGSVDVSEEFFSASDNSTLCTSNSATDCCTLEGKHTERRSFPQTISEEQCTSSSMSSTVKVEKNPTQAMRKPEQERQPGRKPEHQAMRKPEQEHHGRRPEQEHPGRRPEYEHPGRKPEQEHQAMRKPEQEHPGRRPEYEHPGREPEQEHPGRKPEQEHPGRKPEQEQPGRKSEYEQQAWRKPEQEHPGRRPEYEHPGRKPEQEHPGRKPEQEHNGRKSEYEQPAWRKPEQDYQAVRKPEYEQQAVRKPEYEQQAGQEPIEQMKSDLQYERLVQTETSFRLKLKDLEQKLANHQAYIQWLKNNQADPSHIAKELHVERNQLNCQARFQDKLNKLMEKKAKLISTISNDRQKSPFVRQCCQKSPLSDRSSPCRLKCKSGCKKQRTPKTGNEKSALRAKDLTFKVAPSLQTFGDFQCISPLPDDHELHKNGSAQLNTESDITSTISTDYSSQSVRQKIPKVSIQHLEPELRSNPTISRHYSGEELQQKSPKISHRHVAQKQHKQATVSRHELQQKMSKVNNIADNEQQKQPRICFHNADQQEQLPAILKQQNEKQQNQRILNHSADLHQKHSRISKQASHEWQQVTSETAKAGSRELRQMCPEMVKHRSSLELQQRIPLKQNTDKELQQKTRIFHLSAPELLQKPLRITKQFSDQQGEQDTRLSRQPLDQTKQQNHQKIPKQLAIEKSQSVAEKTPQWDQIVARSRSNHLPEKAVAPNRPKGDHKITLSLVVDKTDRNISKEESSTEESQSTEKQVNPIEDFLVVDLMQQDSTSVSHQQICNLQSTSDIY